MMVPPRHLASCLSTRRLSHPPPRWPALLPGNRHAGFALWLVPAVPDNAASVYVPMLLASDNASAAILFPCFSLGCSSPKNPLDGNCLPPPLRQLALPEFFPPLAHSIVIAVPANSRCSLPFSSCNFRCLPRWIPRLPVPLCLLASTLLVMDGPPVGPNHCKIV